MSIYADIQKITRIPQTSENPLFIRKKEHNMLKKNRKLRKPKPPQNANLYDFDDTENTSQMCNVVPQVPISQEYEIATSIREANCGINYSNENLEEQWKSRQMEARLKSGTNTCGKNMLDTNTNKKRDIETEEYILRKYKLNKNAVIRGLLRNHTISLKDLEIPNDCTHTVHESSANVQNVHSDPQCDANETHSMTLVQCPDEPDVFVQPLQAHGTIDETKYKNIDFTVPHVGKKKIITSRRFFVDMDDNDFCFVKKNERK